MSAAVYYKDSCLLVCSGSFLADISQKMIFLALKKGHKADENLVNFIYILNHSSAFSIDDELSVEELKLFAKFGIEAIDQLFKENYFIPKLTELEWRMENNIPLDLPMREYYPALEFKKNLQELLDELNSFEAKESI